MGGSSCEPNVYFREIPRRSRKGFLVAFPKDSSTFMGGSLLSLKRKGNLLPVINHGSGPQVRRESNLEYTMFEAWPTMWRVVHSMKKVWFCLVTVWFGYFTTTESRRSLILQLLDYLFFLLKIVSTLKIPFVSSFSQCTETFSCFEYFKHHQHQSALFVG